MSMKALWLTGAMWLVLVVLVPASASHGFYLANLALMPVVGLACVSLEQLVVATVARGLGDRPLLVSLGVGPELFKLRFGQAFAVSWRALPIVGMTFIMTTQARGQRRRIAVAMFAGVAALVGVMALVVLLAHHTLHELEQRLASKLALDSVVLLATFFPVYIDGLGALGVLTGTPGLSKIDDGVLRTRRKVGIAMRASILIDRHAYDQAMSLLKQGLADSPDDATLQALLGVAMSGRDDPDAFAFVEALMKRDVPETFRAMCQNMWAWQCYLRGADELRSEADRASLAAVEAQPDHASFLDTRGHVLMWNGRYAEAERHLQRAYDLASAPQTRASAAAGLAMVFAASDRPDDAAAWLARGRQEGAHSQIMARAIATVEPLARV